MGPHGAIEIQGSPDLVQIERIVIKMLNQLRNTQMPHVSWNHPITYECVQRDGVTIVKFEVE